MHPLATSLTFSGLAVVLAACAGLGGGNETSAAADPADATVTVVADDVTFVDPPRELPAGTITIAVDNVGDAPHDVTFERVDGSTVAARGGETAAGEVTLEPGSYTVYCSVSGHRSAGMEFEVVVG